MPPGYRSLSQTVKRLMALGERGVGTLHVLGHSVRGRPIWGFHLGPDKEDAPQVLIQAQIHAMEWIGTVVAMELLEHFATSPYPGRTGLWVLPSMNPDGFERTLRRFQHNVLAMGRKNANGVDLNRNFPVGFHRRHRDLLGGSSSPASLYYKGPKPLSEPESQTLARLVQEQEIRACLSLHSIGNFLGFPPCMSQTPTPDHDLFLTWTAAMTKDQPRPYRVDTEVNFFPAYGDFDEWLYEREGVLAFLAEIGGMGLDPLDPKSWFQPLAWFNPMDVKPEIQNALPVLRNFVELAQDHGNLCQAGPRGLKKTWRHFS